MSEASPSDPQRLPPEDDAQARRRRLDRLRKVPSRTLPRAGQPAAPGDALSRLLQLPRARTLLCRASRLLTTRGYGEPVAGTATTRDRVRLLRRFLEQRSRREGTLSARSSRQLLRFLAAEPATMEAVDGIDVARLRLLMTLLGEVCD